MTASNTEKRSHERTHFFLVPTEQERVRFWVFKPDDELDARAGVILDVGEGGLRVLVDPSAPLNGTHYRVRVIAVEAPASAPPMTCRMKLAWCEPDGNLGYMAGLQFEDEAGEVVRYVSARPPTSERRTWICCTLRDAQA